MITAAQFLILLSQAFKCSFYLISSNELHYGNLSRGIFVYQGVIRLWVILSVSGTVMGHFLDVLFYKSFGIMGVTFRPFAELCVLLLRTFAIE